MSELIPIVARDGVQTVNARDLHSFLDVGKDFSTWIKGRIEGYGFKVGQDYVIVEDLRSPDLGNAKSRAQMVVDYHLTLDMAKELAMVERNERGKQARAYFIACERRAKAASDPMALFNDPAALRAALLSYSEKTMALEAKVQEQAPKVLALDRIATADGSLCITDAAKTLQVQPKKLFEYLRQKCWVYQRAGTTTWVAYQDKLQVGVLEHKVTTVTRSDGSEKTVSQVRITPRGLTRLAAEFGSVTDSQLTLREN